MVDHKHCWHAVDAWVELPEHNETIRWCCGCKMKQTHRWRIKESD